MSNSSMEMANTGILLPPLGDGSPAGSAGPRRTARQTATQQDIRSADHGTAAAPANLLSLALRSTTAVPKGGDRSTTWRQGRRGTIGTGVSTFSFAVRARITQAHLDAHAIVRERVVNARGQGQAASYAGLAAEIRALSEVRQLAARGHGAVRAARMRDARACLLSIAASAVLLAEATDRPDDVERRRGQKRVTAQWTTPDFDLQ